MVAPAWLLRFLPHALVIIAVLGFIAWIDHRGYQRARADITADLAKQRADFQADLRNSEGNMAAVINLNDNELAGKLDKMRIYNRTVIQPAVEREIANDPFLARSDARLSDGLWRTLNTALTGSTCSRRPDGGIECPLPAPVAAVGPDDSDTGAGDLAERQPE